MKNWYGTFSFEPDELLVPQTTLLPGEQALGAEVVASDELPARVVAAEEFGKSVRAAGNAWSSLDVMAARDVVVYAGTMNRIRQYAQGEATWLDESEVMSLALLPAVKTTERRLVHVEAGIRIRDLTQKLAAPKEPGRPPWCIPNLGAATGQTLIGAISTGTHGGAFDRPPIADSVRAIRMVGPGGREYWIEPAPTRSITDPTALAAQLPGVNIRYDDEIFYSALVAVGSFGIVTEVVIEVEEMFGQSQRVRPVSWSQVRAALKNWSAFNNPNVLAPKNILNHPSLHGTTTAAGQAVVPVPEGFEILVNPYRQNDFYGDDFIEAIEESGILDTVGDITGLADAVAKANEPPERSCVFVSRAAAFGVPVDEGNLPPKPSGPDEVPAGLHVEFNLSGQYRHIIDQIMLSQRSDLKGYYPTHKVLANDPDGTDPGLSLELSISTEKNQHLALMDAILKRFDELVGDGRNYAGFFALRFTRPSRAYLAMQSYPKKENLRVCHIEVFGLKEIHWGSPQNDGNMEGQTDYFIREFVKLGEAAGARLHWGQMHHLDRQRVAADYEKLHQWRRARTRLTRDPGRDRTFSNAFTRRTGLETYHEEITAVAVAGATDLYAYRPGGKIRRMRILDATFSNSVAPSPKWVSVSGPPNGYLKAELGADLAGPLTAAVTSDGAVHLFGETVDGRIKHLRNESAKEVLSSAWTISYLTLPVSFALPAFGPVRGPWSAAAKGNDVHLFGIGSGGSVLHVVVGGAEAVFWRRQPSFKNKRRFVYSISPFFDGNDRVQVVGAGARGELLHGLEVPKLPFNSWRWSPHSVQQQGTSPSAVPAGPLIALPGSGGLHVFGVDRVWRSVAGKKGKRLFWLRGSAADPSWSWRSLPFFPGYAHVDFVARDKGASDAYASVGEELIYFPEPVGPVAAVRGADGRNRVFARADTGQILAAEGSGGDDDWTTVTLG